ncbi:MAG: hypothetical protein EAX90_09075 [Candidatus Heimdallarchaeota archaeon]|nr:hypothetical protein [Candidatus Heimdallarchaeota archaeon]
MIADPINNENRNNVSFRNIFKIFLKTSRKRVILFIISGTLIFLAITGFLMVWFSYRSTAFAQFIDNYHDWNNDNMISVFSSNTVSGMPEFDLDYMDNFTKEYQRAANELIPNVAGTNYTSALSGQFYGFDPLEYVWLDYEIMTLNTPAYDMLENFLVAGRMPKNSSELLYFQMYSFANFWVNDTATIYAVENLVTLTRDYNIVGVVKDIDYFFPSSGFSGDIFKWSDIVGEFDTYNREELFLTNVENFTEIINSYPLFSGVVMQATEFNYDISAIDLANLYDFINTFPTGSNYFYSNIVGYYIDLCPDLRAALINFADFWNEEIINIISISAPLLFLIGLISMVTLNIGSRELERTFRIMKLKGLDYSYIQKIILLENVSLTLFSMLIGSSLGILAGYLYSFSLANRPEHFYSSLLAEPSLYVGIASFILILFSIGFFIENSIAKSTIKAQEQFKLRRERLRKIFSTNEFRLLVITLVVSIFALGGYLIYRYTGPSTFYTAMWSYLLLFWFLIILSITLLCLFVLLMIARLIAILWTYFGKNIWQKNKNLLTLSIKHISFNKKGYQKIVIISLIFGLGFLPGLIMKRSTQDQLALEAELTIGCSELAITDWFDPSENKRPQIESWDCVNNVTEVTVYKIFNFNEYLYYPRAFTMNLVVIDELENFTNIINFNLLEQQNITKEDILSLSSTSTFFMDTKYAKKKNFEFGDPFTSTDFTIQRNEFNLTYTKSFKYFPLLPLPKKELFYQFMDYYSMVTSRETGNLILDSQDVDSNVAVNKVLLIKPRSVEDIPTIKFLLRDLRFSAYTKEDINADLYLSISPFSNNLLILTTIMTIFTLIFVGYFSAREVYLDRVRIIESFYRVGANRRQIWGSFTLELLFTAALPIIISSFVYLPFYKILGTDFLNVQERFYYIQIWHPAWILILTLLIGLIAISSGWLLGIIPLVRSYKPIKQE